jgi:hypothetical protein
MTLNTLFGVMGLVLVACGAAFAVSAPRHPAYEDILHLVAGSSLLVGLCCFGIELERAFGTALFH